MPHDSIDLLREDLTTARYRVDVLDGLWGAAASAALFRGRRLPAERALARRRASGAGPQAVDTLAALFVLGSPVPEAELETALPRLGVAGARELGLVGAADAEGGSVRALLDLRPYSFVDALGAGSWWIVSDLGEAVLGHALDEDHVLGIGGASTTLSGLMIPTPADSVLDLGTGCGIQAMHAARHARRVVATDISRRALEIAALNARLNGIDSIEFRYGSLFEPVAGERFDRIVSNPPFVITPRVDGVPQYEYRDGGLEGDALVEQVVRQAGEHLTPGGIAQLLGNWEYRGSGAGVSDGLDRVRSWVEGAAGGDSRAGAVNGAGAGAGGTMPGSAVGRSGAGARAGGGGAVGGGATLDAWVVERERQDAPTYAETWIRDGGTRPGTPEFERLYAAWLDDFEARGVFEVGFGYVLLRRPAAAVSARSGRAGAGADVPAMDAGGNAPTAEGVSARSPAGEDGVGRASGVRSGAPTLARYERVDSALGDNPVGLGDHLAVCLAGHDWQAARDDAALLRERLVYASDVTEERHYWPGQEDPVVMTLRQGGGFGRAVGLDTGLAALVGACDGDLSLGALCSAIAEVLDVDDAALRAELLPRIRALVSDAFLLPAD
ncbi:methyltransferase [Herbiconiux sp. 11R-BC]|uniref:DUF7059 domain-containing protein n=1 Tax=Herbiconiux sp. 11R-BC TaxID=3111637 RepID=UPI003C00F7A7